MGRDYLIIYRFAEELSSLMKSYTPGGLFQGNIVTNTRKNLTKNSHRTNSNK